MSRVLYLDIPAGLAGDMFVASLLDLGCPWDELQKAISDLGIEASLTYETVMRGPFKAKRFIVEDKEHHHGHHHRAYSDIVSLITSSNLSDRVKTNSLAIFEAIGKAEASIHNVSLEKVHFHEVGAVDSIADIVCACLGLDLLKIDKIVASEIPLGKGFIHTAHGKMPLPAPAAAELLKGWPVKAAEEISPGFTGEQVTPTGAGILSVLASPGNMPNMVLKGIGYGAGSRNEGPIPNVCRAFLGDSANKGDQVEVLTCNMDDMTGEFIAPLMEELLLAGALDVTATPTIMKKGRPGIVFEVIAPQEKGEILLKKLFQSSTTIGIRRQLIQRVTLNRHKITLDTKYGPISAKVVDLSEAQHRVKPEMDECIQISRKMGIPLMEVYTEALSCVKLL